MESFLIKLSSRFLHSDSYFADYSVPQNTTIRSGEVWAGMLRVVALYRTKSSLPDKVPPKG